MGHGKGGAKVFHKTGFGKILHGDSLIALRQMKAGSVNLIMTSPPFGLVRQKDYGNVHADDYVEWFKEFGAEFRRILADDGSLVIDIGGAWNKGLPTRSLYHFKLLIMLCEEIGLHLAEEFYWWNPSKLPTPAEWVNIRRIRAKDAVNCVWWLSKTPWPKASNRRVLQPYSDAMRDLLKNGYKAKKRPSGHDISTKFSIDNGAAIPPNLLAIANTDSNGQYLTYCKEKGLKPNPARYPGELPEFFIRMLTDEGDTVIDPFAGSCVTGEVCERLKRRWTCIELEEEYLLGAIVRFDGNAKSDSKVKLGKRNVTDESNYYKIPRPGLLWGAGMDEPLPADGGRTRPASVRRAAKSIKAPKAVRQEHQPPSATRTLFGCRPDQHDKAK